METWKTLEARLRAAGISDAGALDAARRATAPERHMARVAEVRSLMEAAAVGLTDRIDVMVLLGLDMVGCGGVGGMGGKSARIPQLRAIPRRQQHAGGAWSAAVESAIYACNNREETGCWGAWYLDAGGDDTPWLALSFMREEEPEENDATPALLDAKHPVALALLASCSAEIRACVHRIAVAAAGGSAPSDVRLAGEPAAWSRLLEVAEAESIAMALEDCSDPTYREGLLSRARELRPQARSERLAAAMQRGLQ